MRGEQRPCRDSSFPAEGSQATPTRTRPTAGPPAAPCAHLATQLDPAGAARLRTRWRRFCCSVPGAEPRLLYLEAGRGSEAALIGPGALPAAASRPIGQRAAKPRWRSGKAGVERGLPPKGARAVGGRRRLSFQLEPAERLATRSSLGDPQQAGVASFRQA